NIAGDDGGGLWIPNVCPIYTIVPFFSDIPLAEEFVTRPNEFRNNRRLTNVNISGNTATGNVAAVPPPASPDDYTGFGGGIWLGRGLELYLINSTVVSNNAGRNGGSVFLHAGVVADPGTNTLTIAGGYLSGSAQRGGGVFVSGGVGDVNGATFNMQSNVPAIPGGSAAVSTGPPTIGNPAGSPFARGVATYDGGGVYVQGGTTATNAGTFYMHTGSVGAANADGTRRGSIAHRNGGGLFLGSPQVTGGQFAQFNMPGTASRSFIGNDADGGLITPTPILTQGRGGGIFIPQNYPAITLPANTSINHNHARWGGGVWISPHHNLTMGTGGAIRGNSAVNDGGGIFVSGGPIASVNGATFTMNGGIIGGATAVDANVAHRGGGVFVQHGSTGTTNNHGVFTFNNGDVRGNRAIVAGGGVFVDDGEAMPGSGLAGALVFAEAYARYFEYHGYHIGHFTAYSEYNDYDGFIGYASDEIDYDGYIGYAPAPVGITPFSFGGSGGVFTMAGGHIRYNTVGSSVVDGDGGGVWVANYAYFNANGVTFNNNQAQWGMGGAIFSARHEYRSPLLRVLPGWAGAANTLAYSNILLTGVSNFTNNSASTLETPPTNATAAIASTLFGTTSGGASITHPLNNYDINFIFLDTDVPFTFIKFDDYNNEPLGGAVFELHRRGTNISPGVYNWTLVSTQTSSSVAATLGQVSFVFSSDAVYRITETVLPTVAGATFIMPSGHWYVTVVNSVITNPGGLPSRSTPLQADTPEFIAGVGSLPPRLPNRRHLPDWRRLNYAINIHQPAPDRIIIHPAGAPGITEGPGPSGSGIFNLVVSDPVNGNPPAYVGRTITTLPILVPTLLASPAGQHRIAINRAVSIEAAPGQDIFLRMNVPNSTNTTNNLPWGTPPTTLGRHFIIYPGGNLTLGGVGSGNLILDGNRAAVTGNRGGVGVASVAPASVAQLTMRAGSTIRNCRATEGGGVHLSGNNASFTMYGGTIGGTYTFTPGAGTVVSVAQHNYATTGSGVFVGNGATFTMAQPASGTGGVISGNTNGGAGGGVAVIGNTGVNTVFNMHFGLISGNVSTGGGAGVTNIGSGGGVFVFGTHGIINMHGGTIQHNYTPSWSGGGINLNGGATGTMHSGYIQNNRARISGGGGVAVRYDSTFTMNNGTIRNNASIIGGGVLSYNRGLFTMNNGVIYSNTVHMGGAGIPAFGGGGLAVIANSRGYMHGGTIRDHVVNLPGGLGYGGGVLIGLISGFPGIHQDGVNSFTMTGGYIINNEARYGGGIHLPGGPFIAGGTYNHNRVVMNGGTIRGNDARRYGGGINVIQNGIFNMSAGTIGGMRPGGLLPLDPNPNANTADYGGGVRLTGGAQFNLSGTGAKRIIGNVAEYSGGGVWVALNSHMRMHRTPTPAATNLHVSYNIAGYMGGGIYTMDRGTSPNDYPNPLPTTAGVSTLYLNLTLNADTVFEGNSASFLAIPPNNLLPPSLPLTVLPNIAWNTTTPTLPDMGHHHPINNFDINFRSQLISFQFTKTDNAITPQTGAPLPGAIFQLYRRADAVSPWVSVGLPVTSAANGVVAFNLTPAGQYRIVEVLAPSGYDTPFGYWILDVTVVSGALTVTGVTSHGGNPPFVRHPANTGNWYVGNRPGINLPMSGGFGAAQFAVTGSAIIVVAAVGALAVAFTAKRKRATKAVARYNRTMD
ncbi:MAG: SpaA isopeptide-forming pilin-related protein, partial [Defluviitaleaceae bacterium]|nr:SpaA isopeptide-forming pilin-related protein [Defluviitaleaceae bacterium]